MILDPADLDTTAIYKLLIGRMHRYHVEDALISNGRIDTRQLDPLGRMAGNFTCIETLFDLPLPESDLQ